MTADSRGQLVLVAAIALAVALVPLAVAYLQLGYHEDVGATAESEPAKQITKTLDRGLANATADVPGTHAWAERDEAIATVRQRLAPVLDAIDTARLADGQVYQVTYNETRAHSWASEGCPVGPDRQFGPCESKNGVVVQERDGQTHVLAAAFDVQITTPDGVTTITTVRRLAHSSTTS